jgi:hypothetical protein
MTTVTCLRCQGSGTTHAHDRIKPGILLDLCDFCAGAGEIGGHDPSPPFRAMFMVGTRFIVRITVPRVKGGFVELDVEWSPNMPREKGPGKLRPSERLDYESGRTQALQQHMAQMGGGDWSVIGAKERQ